VKKAGFFRNSFLPAAQGGRGVDLGNTPGRDDPNAHYPLYADNVLTFCFQYLMIRMFEFGNTRYILKKRKNHENRKR